MIRGRSRQNKNARGLALGVPPVRIELTPPAPEAGALSAELWGQLTLVYHNAKGSATVNCDDEADGRACSAHNTTAFQRASNRPIGCCATKG